jgi:hypothetical protein
MALTQFKLKNTEGLKGLFHKGRLIPFDKIDDTVAAQLYGKTHVLERVEAAPAAAQAQAQLPATTEPAAAEAETPATGRRRPASS